MDVEDVAISAVRKNINNNTLTVCGSNFTRNTKVFVNGTKISTSYLSPSVLTADLDSVKDGDVITVNILGSKGILLREGVGEVIYEDPDIVPETETAAPAEGAGTENSESGDTVTPGTDAEVPAGEDESSPSPTI